MERSDKLIKAPAATTMHRGDLVRIAFEDDDIQAMYHDVVHGNMASDQVTHTLSCWQGWCGGVMDDVADFYPECTPTARRNNAHVRATPRCRAHAHALTRPHTTHANVAPRTPFVQPTVHPMGQPVLRV